MARRSTWLCSVLWLFAALTCLNCAASLHSEGQCDAMEEDCMDFLPAFLQHNYTATGFKRTTLPVEAWEPLIALYEAQEHTDSATIALDHHTKSAIWEAVQPMMEDWIGHPVERISMILRVYKDGDTVPKHVEQQPLVSSAIIQVAQDVDSDWPIEVYDHSGRAHNVSLRPGDMVLYESHTVLHGRPFPLQGRLYANVFVHFQPLGHAARNDLLWDAYEDAMVDDVVDGLMDEYEDGDLAALCAGPLAQQGLCNGTDPYDDDQSTYASASDL